MIHQPITADEPTGATSRFLADFAKDRQPTIEVSIKRVVTAMPITQQIALIQSIVEGEDWQEMSYVDSQRLDTILANFAGDMEHALLVEDLAVHGHRVIA